MSWSKALSTSYPIDWNGKRYYYGPVTLSIMGKYEVWCKKMATLEAESYKQDMNDSDFQSLKKGVIASCMSRKFSWGGEACNDYLASARGQIEFVRLMLNEPLSDEEVSKIVSDKGEDFAAIAALLEEEEKTKKSQAEAVPTEKPPSPVA